MPDHTDPASAAAWKARIDQSKRIRNEIVRDWTDNVSFRRGKPFTEESDEHRINVNQDWPRTKAKHANLFSQVPEVYLLPKKPEVAQAVPAFAKALNSALTAAKAGVAVDESVIDCINASGVGVVVCGYERRTEEVEVPAIDLAGLPPEIAAGLMQSGDLPMEKVERTVSDQFTVRRISPSDLLWPADFVGSDFDDAPWIGRSGLVTWAEAKHQFDLPDSVKDKVMGAGRPSHERLVPDETEPQREDSGMVEFDEVFYWAYRYDPKEKHFKAIRRLVFVVGMEKPAVDEPWNGQRFSEETGEYIGSLRFPIRVLTLTYVSDDAVPPSDTAIGRPQVLELIKSRSQMVLQRDRSLPIRWLDVNRVDPAVQDSMMRGQWQAVVPLQGDGSRAIGEVARANYPREDMEFDRVAKADLDDAWQTGANQQGNFASGERSASEAQIVQANFQTRIGYERARVAAFFVGIAEVLAGLLALYGRFETLTEDERQALEPIRSLAGEFAYSIRPDSTVLLDANQRIQRLMGVLNMIGQSPFVNAEAIIREIVSLSGLNPDEVMVQPEPPKPEPPNMSVRLSGTEDLLNPMVLAFLVAAGLAPSQEDLETAKQMLLASMQPPQPPGGPEGAEADAAQGMPAEAAVGASPSGSPTPTTQADDGGIVMNAMPKITKRTQETR